MRWIAQVAALFVIAAGTAAHADAPLLLELPVACDMASVCSIQKHFDLDPGPERRDYACGRLTMDGHDGTDIRVPDWPTMESGVAVLAAAPGVVKATRDGMEDVSIRAGGSEGVSGREAGNGVVIDHGNGWETQYSHLRRGSVAVHRGDQVAAGDRLGLIGLSGNTEFPHVHFSVRYQGRAIDPFVGLAASTACGDERAPLWSPKASSQLPYRPSGPLAAGFATDRPEAEQARRGQYAAQRLPADSAVLVFWADIWGAMVGDTQRIRITGPGNRPVHQTESVLQASNISWFAFGGSRRPEQGWAPGAYTGTYELIRKGAPVVTISETVQVGD